MHVSNEDQICYKAKAYAGDPATAEGSDLGYCFGWTKDCDACKSGPTFLLAHLLKTFVKHKDDYELDLF